jgi:hypothetical protein
VKATALDTVKFMASCAAAVPWALVRSAADVDLTFSAVVEGELLAHAAAPVMAAQAASSKRRFRTCRAMLRYFGLIFFMV